MGNIITEGEDKLDLDTGYFTRESFLIDSDACNEFEASSTQFIRDMKITKGKRAWYLTSITLPGGVLFPDGKKGKQTVRKTKIKWVVAPVVPVDEDYRQEIPGSPGNYYETRVGIEDAKQFDKFKEGLVYLGML